MFLSRVLLLLAAVLPLATSFIVLPLTPRSFLGVKNVVKSSGDSIKTCLEGVYADSATAATAVASGFTSERNSRRKLLAAVATAFTTTAAVPAIAEAKKNVAAPANVPKAPDDPFKAAFK